MATLCGHFASIKYSPELRDHGDVMREEVSKSKFKARALELFRRVETSGESVVVTDHGKPTIEVRPYRELTRSPLERLKSSVINYKDPMEPVGVDDWEENA